MSRTRHDFERLRSWAALPDGELERVIDAEAVAVLRRVASLIGRAERATLPIDRATFVATVREFDELYREGSRSLGVALIEAQALLDRQDHAGTREVYERFLAGCNLKFHRDIARFQLRRLDGGPR